MKTLEVEFVSAYIGQVHTCSYKPKFTQILAQIETSGDGCGQCFYIELSRLAEFMDFIGINDWSCAVSHYKTHFVEKGKHRIKSIVKIVENIEDCKRFIINNVFDHDGFD